MQVKIKNTLSQSIGGRELNEIKIQTCKEEQFFPLSSAQDLSSLFWVYTFAVLSFFFLDAIPICKTKLFHVFKIIAVIILGAQYIYYLYVPFFNVTVFYRRHVCGLLAN